MVVYRNWQDAIAYLEARTRDAERDHDRYDRIVAAKGDCSVIGGWTGKLPIGKARSLRDEYAGRVVAMKSATQIVKDALQQIGGRPGA